jgi:hypothetical protein
MKLNLCHITPGEAGAKKPHDVNKGHGLRNGKLRQNLL